MITVAVVTLPAVPLGITTVQSDGTSVVEWVWSRHPLFSGVADFLDRMLWPTIAAACLIGVARFGYRYIERGTSNRNVMAYSLLLIASAHWMLAVQQSASSPHKELKPLWVLYDPAASGYFYEAAFDIEDTPKFLKTYEARMAEGDVLHVGTHPPGMFLLAKGCIEACRNFPAIKSMADAVTAKSTVEAFRFVEQNARLKRSLTNDELAGLKLLSLITFTLAALTIVPLCLLANRIFLPTTAWMICCLWPTVPAISIFFPKSDVIFPSLSLLLLVFATAGSQSIKKAIFTGVTAGIVLLLASCLSLAILPTVVVIGIFLTQQIAKAPRDNGTAALVLIGTVTATVVFSMFAIDQLFDCNLLAIFRQNLTNHEGFYQQFHRTYWKWLLVNPIELSFAVGVPVMGLAVTSTAWLFQKQPSGSAATEESKDATDGKLRPATVHRMNRSMLIALATTIALLWISGKNNGEAARLWCFMTPWVLLLSGTTVQRLFNFVPRSHRNKTFTWILVTQLLLCLITVSRVNGFSF